MKHLDKILFVICMACFAWGFMDRDVRHWSMIGGNLAFVAYMVLVRKKKGLPLLDFGLILMIGALMLLVAIEINASAQSIQNTP